jgi:hypothetical protein
VVFGIKSWWEKNEEEDHTDDDDDPYYYWTRGKCGEGLKDERGVQKKDIYEEYRTGVGYTSAPGCVVK